MIIEKALLTDSHKIAELLSLHYQYLNKNLGQDYYSFDLELMKKHVMERIMNTKSDFSYFVCRENTGDLDFLGFVNVLSQNNRGEILVLLLNESIENSSNAPEIRKQLFSYALNFFKSNNVSKITIELNDEESELLELVNEMSPKKMSSYYLLTK